MELKDPPKKDPTQIAQRAKIQISQALYNLSLLDPARQLSLARTKLEEAHMWVEQIYPK